MAYLRIGIPYILQIESKIRKLQTYSGWELTLLAAISVCYLHSHKQSTIIFLSAQQHLDRKGVVKTDECTDQQVFLPILTYFGASNRSIDDGGSNRYAGL